MQALIGATVQLQHLHKETMNGQCGQVVSFDDVTRRYAVTLNNGKQLAVKSENGFKCASGQRRAQRQVSREECITEVCQYIDDVASDMFGESDQVGRPHMDQLMGRCARDIRTAMSALEQGRFVGLDEPPLNTARSVFSHIVQWRAGAQARALPTQSLVDDVSMYMHDGMRRWVEDP